LRTKVVKPREKKCDKRSKTRFYLNEEGD